MKTIGLAVAFLIAASACSASVGTGTLPLVKVADVPLGGRTTRMDYASYDQGRRLLFIAHLGDSSVIVFDTQANRVVARIAGVKAVHGALAIPELGRVYATATGSNEVVAIDETTLKIVARAPTGEYPDGMAYAPEAHKLYVSNELGAAVTVVDVRSNMRKATIALGGEVGNSQYDPVSRHVFANVQGLSQLVEIDPATDTVVARIDLPGARGNHGLLIDPQRRLAFIACEDNAKLLVLNLTTHRIVASFDVGRDPDVLAIDPEPGWVYVASEAGVVSVFKAQAGTVTRIGEGMLGSNAHVVAVDPTSHLSYFPLKDLRGETVLRIMRMQH
ncbi:MAG TPA: YncE family protein [Xanthomonadaceae bacterium]|nr:YncE family protein [Xanthomonadaceae bacterium]